MDGTENGARPPQSVPPMDPGQYDRWEAEEAARRAHKRARAALRRERLVPRQRGR